MSSLALMPNRSTNVEYTTSAPIAFKPLLCPSAFFRLFILSFVIVSWCVGLVALLHFLALVCALAKNANVLTNALAYLCCFCLSINILTIKNTLTITSTTFQICLPNAILKNGWNSKARPP